MDWLRRLSLECCAQAMLAGKRNTVAILTMLLWLIPIGTHAVTSLPPEAELDTFIPKPLPHWTQQEKWVWKQLVLGESADFNDLYNEKLEPTKDDQRWADLAKPRSLSNRFLQDVLQDVLSDESRSGFVHPAGLQIVGALFKEEANLDFKVSGQSGRSKSNVHASKAISCSPVANLRGDSHWRAHYLKARSTCRVLKLTKAYPCPMPPSRRKCGLLILPLRGISLPSARFFSMVPTWPS
jgi:hypothetical protein